MFELIKQYWFEVSSVVKKSSLLHAQVTWVGRSVGILWSYSNYITTGYRMLNFYWGVQQLDVEKSLFYRKMMERWARLLFQADDYTMMLLSGTVKQRVVHLIQWLTDYTDAEDKT